MVLAWLVRLCAALFFWSVPAGAWAQMHFGSLLEEEVVLDVRIGGREVRLEAFAVRPAVNGRRLPIAIITHGKPGSSAAMAAVRANRYRPIALDFARRGYLAVSVVRRGFGRSDGPFPVPLSCSATSIAERFEAAADDLEAALRTLAGRPDADANRIVAIGASTGGMAVMALAARNPAGLRAVFNFSGGLRFRECPKEDLLVETVARLAVRSRVPVLWLYSDNDSFFPPPLVDRMYRGLPSGQSGTDLARIGALPRDGHFLFGSSAGRMQWLGTVDAFLRRQGLPTWEAGDVEKLVVRSGLGPSYRTVLERYLAAPSQKVLAWAPSKQRAVFFAGNRMLRQARARGLAYCRERLNAEDCQIVMEDLQRVGATPDSSPAPDRAKAGTTTGPSVDRLEELRLQLKVSVRARPFLKKYLARPGHKALARGRERAYFYSMSNQSSLASARRLALERCREKVRGPCDIVMEGERIVASP